MNRNMNIFRKLALLIVLFIVIGTLSAQDDFSFKLVRPDSNDQIIDKTDKLSVEITFDAAAVNKIGAYIATVADSKMVGFSAATTMESPFTDEIPATHLGEGKHIVEYMLLPSGSKDQAEALANIAINLEVKEGPFTTEFDIEDFAQDIIKIISENDEEGFKNYCIDQKAMNGIIDGIKGDSPKDNGVKAELSTFNTEDIRNEMTANFIKLQQSLSEKEADRTTIEFLGFLEKDINLEMPGFSAMDIRFGINVDGNSFTISTNAFITKDKAYLFGFEFNSGLL